MFFGLGLIDRKAGLEVGIQDEIDRFNLNSRISTRWRISDTVIAGFYVGIINRGLLYSDK